MFDIGWPEMAVVAVIAVIIIGPKDLPRIMRWVGGWVGKARTMARQFQRSIDDMAREADVADLKKDIDSVSKINPTRELDNAIDPTGSVKKALDPAAADDTATAAPEAKPETIDETPTASVTETPAEPSVGDSEPATDAPKTQASA
jgi:sec-independent protein translocase protein TatB